MQGHEVTNPWLVMAINMTIVFGVLIALGILMQIVHWIDPTRRRAKPEASEAPAEVPTTSAAPSAAPSDDGQIVAAIAGAIVAMGYSSDQIVAIHPVVSRNWKLDGRMDGRE